MKSLLHGKNGELGKTELCAPTPFGELVALVRSLRLMLETISAIPATSRSTHAMCLAYSRFDRTTVRTSPGLDLPHLTIDARCLVRELVTDCAA